MASLVGKYVIVRCTQAGVHAGELLEHKGPNVVLKDARRLWYWKPANGLKFLSGVAEAGLHTDSKIGIATSLLALTEACEISVCSAEAEASIRSIGDDRA